MTQKFSIIERQVQTIKEKYRLKRKRVDKADIFRICKAENISLIFNNKAKIKGEYLNYKNRRIIVLNSKLNLRDFIFVALHELGHHFLHFEVVKSNQSFRFHILDNKLKTIESEANLFAQLMLKEDK